MALDKQIADTEDAREIANMIAKARVAQAQIENYTQEQVDELIKAMVWSCCQPGVAEEIAQHTLDETQLGDYNGKFLKINTKTRAALMDIIDDISVGVIEEDTERNIIKIAKPVGVIGALSPSTNPEATPVIKGINAVKGRNAIIVAPHPRAKLTNKMIVDKMRAALEAMGAPADLVQAIELPSLEKTNELMKQCDLILATGGPAMVKSAYSSGTPALGVGAGNAVITVDETANLDEAAEKIRISKTLDLAASCSSDNSVIAVEAIYEQLLEKLIAQGGYLASEEDYRKIADVLWEDGALNTKAVVLKPQVLCELAGVDIPEDRLFIIMPETGTGPEHPYSGEKLSVIMAFYKVKDIDEAVALTNEIQAYQGMGHSCGIYSNNDEHILKLGMGTKTSRVMVNQPQAPSNSGNLWNGMRQTFSLGCGTWGGNSTNENINWKHLVNITWISKPLATPKVLPADEVLFGDVINKLK
ncbi:aldehyde dehydrogenase family protein [Pseudomaricurvus alkylphenolicus]|jgi:sulfoacetaldehyde dehydrogenase|uniref:aldehyde dehydrogenase family protein n=1 Tax=Pseudomaricurvus alkylphenolicus TaxID=1306991 RepID=UPI001420D04B|nr:aldehyde dehydrogenase family protein [Pseudomaricurvus alkylphenolicus]NIB44622.1 aldehyde dehydrogenase family protein [Pseudomaricurvus alkylphenolicus]